MSLQNVLKRQYTALIRHWPADPLRPNLNFSETLSYRVEQYFGTHADMDASLPTQNTGAPSGAAEDATARQVYRFDAPKIQNEINVLGNLLENRFQKLVGFL